MSLKDEITKKIGYLINTELGHHQPHPPIRRPVIFGFVVLIVFFSIFIGWGALSTLESAAVAPGKVIVASNRKTVQHLEGGIIKKFNIKEGSIVKKGDVLIELEDTSAKANYELYHSAVTNFKANEARLMALRDNASAVSFPDSLVKEKNDPDVAKLINSQEKLFNSQQNAYTGQLEILNKRIAQLNTQIESYKAQITSNNEQLKLIQEELKALLTLDKEHLVEKPKIWALKREAARLTGNRDELAGSIAQAQQKIGETEQQLYTFRDSYQKDNLEKLTETQGKLSEALEKEKAAEDVYSRTKIIAPINGMVVGLQEHTEGGVIQGGKEILEIVPTGEALVIEAKVNPLNIEAVHVGLNAKVQLLAYKRRSTPYVDGKVTYVSADSFQDPHNNTSYYIAYVVVSAKQLSQLPGVVLSPGMPVEVFIITDKRTPLAYFFTPIKESFRRAFREK